MAGMVNPSIIREGLIARGVPPHIADGFVMNMRDESGLNPGINEAAPIVPGSRGGYGLYQVTGPRRTAYEQFAEGRGSPLNSVDAQLDFLMTELQGPESRAARSIMAAPDANSAAVAIAKDFLRPSPEHLQRRVDRYSGGASVANDTMAALGRSPIGGNQMVTSAQGGPEQEQGRGGLLGFFSDPDKRAKLAIALEGMTLNPNTAYMQMLGADIKGRADDRKTVEGKKQQAATMNKTVEWLRNNGAADLADALMTGAIDPGAAVSAQMGRMKPQEPGYRTARGSELGLTGPDAEKLFNIGPDNKITAIGGGGTSVNIENMGNIPAGWQLVEDPQTGAKSMQPIPGGPAEREIKAQEAAAAAASQAETQRVQQADTGQGIKASTVGRSVDRLVGMMDKGGIFNLPEAGIIGSALGGLGVNQEAVTFKNELAAIQSAVAFDTLQKMREASKTGGALGAVSERELDLLISAYGGIQQSSDPATLKENLMTIKNIMSKIENDPIASRAYYGGPIGSGAQPSSNGFSVTGRID